MVPKETTASEHRDPGRGSGLCGPCGITCVRAHLHPDDGVDEEYHGDEESDIRQSLREREKVRLVLLGPGARQLNDSPTPHC